MQSQCELVDNVRVQIPSTGKPVFQVELDEVLEPIITSLLQRDEWPSRVRGLRRKTIKCHMLRKHHSNALMPARNGFIKQFRRPADDRVSSALQ
jgi:hypothetical protein